jgi:hypothetical protein
MKPLNLIGSWSADGTFEATVLNQWSEGALHATSSLQGRLTTTVEDGRCCIEATLKKRHVFTTSQENIKVQINAHTYKKGKLF